MQPTTLSGGIDGPVRRAAVLEALRHLADRVAGHAIVDIARASRRCTEGSNRCERTVIRIRIIRAGACAKRR